MDAPAGKKCLAECSAHTRASVACCRVNCLGRAPRSAIFKGREREIEREEGKCDGDANVFFRERFAPPGIRVGDISYGYSGMFMDRGPLACMTIHYY